MGIMLLQNHDILVFLVFLFCLKPQLSFSSSSSNATCHPLQRHALLLFKSSFVVDPKAYCTSAHYHPIPNIESWKNDTNCCFWDGVVCDEATGYVIGLRLSCSMLVGTIHSNNSIFSSHIAPYLHTLELARNDFLGSQLDVKFGSFTSLRYLDVHDSNISGPIPSLFGNLTLLTQLTLTLNHLSGSIPSSLGNLVELTYLDLSYNDLNGPIPTSFSNLTRLVYLDMGYNELEGPLPSYLFALPSLEHVSLSQNKLYGQIHTSPVKSMNLSILFLSNNNLSGSLDFDVFSNFKQLMLLDLSNYNISSSSTNTNISYSLPNLYYLALSGCNLNQFPPFIQALTNLSNLIISNNQIEGSIPDWIYEVGKYTMTRIDISENLLSSVGHLVWWKNIEFIDFHSNLLHGPLPIPPTTTHFFSASNNCLSGEISSLICNLSDINLLDLSRNLFTGLMPPCLGKLTSLSVLNLNMNKLHGVIPNTFVQLNNSMDSLILNGNKLRGPIPQSLMYCSGLQILDLGNNMIEDTLPSWLPTLSSLKVLVLRSNKFFGSLDDFKANSSFPLLRILDISNNNFTGRLPVTLITNLNAIAKVDEAPGDSIQYMKPGSYDKFYYSVVINVKGFEMKYEKMLTTFTAIDLSKNKFEGSISEAIGKLIALKGLNLSHNLLTGHIPSSLGNLISLEWLDLSFNELSGRIPSKLTDLTFLEVLNLSHNHLDGPIPQGSQFNTFVNDSYKDNLALCGFPLSISCMSNHEPPPFTFEKEDFSSSGSGFSWEGPAYAGCGCGIVLGLSMGYVVFEIGSPKWFVRIVDIKQSHGRIGKRSKRHGRRKN